MHSGTDDMFLPANHGFECEGITAMDSTEDLVVPSLASGSCTPTLFSGDCTPMCRSGANSPQLAGFAFAVSPGSLRRALTTRKGRAMRAPIRSPQSAADGDGISFRFPSRDAGSQLQVVHSQYRTSFSPEPHVAASQRPSPLRRCQTPPSGDSVEDMEVVSDEELFVPYEFTASPVPALVTPLPAPTHTRRRIKQCACCHCTNTPLWRDIGAEMPLCNACGIRWKKYGLVCAVCQYVPCKQERDDKNCKRCGAMLPAPSKRARMPAAMPPVKAK